MKNIQLTITDAEYKALACEAMNVEEYLQNYASVRGRKAYDNIVRKEVNRRLDEGLDIPKNKDEIIMSENLKTLSEIESLEKDSDDT